MKAAVAAKRKLEKKYNKLDKRRKRRTRKNKSETDYKIEQLKRNQFEKRDEMDAKVLLKYEKKKAAARKTVERNVEPIVYAMEFIKKYDRAYKKFDDDEPIEEKKYQEHGTLTVTFSCCGKSEGYKGDEGVSDVTFFVYSIKDADGNSISIGLDDYEDPNATAFKIGKLFDECDFGEDWENIEGEMHNSNFEWHEDFLIVEYTLTGTLDNGHDMDELPIIMFTFSNGNVQLDDECLALLIASKGRARDIYDALCSNKMHHDDPFLRECCEAKGFETLSEDAHVKLAILELFHPTLLYKWEKIVKSGQEKPTLQLFIK